MAKSPFVEPARPMSILLSDAIWYHQQTKVLGSRLCRGPRASDQTALGVSQPTRIRVAKRFFSVYFPCSSTPELPYGPRLVKALRDFSTINWTKVTRNGQPVLSGPGITSSLSSSMLPTFEEGEGSRSPLPSIAEFAAEIGPNIQLKQHLKAYFLENINCYYKFVDPSWLNFSDVFPNNDTALQLLYSAIFAAAAYSSPLATREVAENFIAYAENLVQQCYLHHLCLPVLQGLLIIAWYKHVALDLTKGNMYHYMAIGLSTHLGIKDASELKQDLSDIANIRTFWCLYLLDRTSTPKLGCQSGIPWEIDRVAPYINTVPVELIDIPALAFEYHCRLYRLSEQFIDPLYLSTFPKLPVAEKQAIAAKANGALLAFRKQIDKRLFVGRNVKPHKTQLVFWISYHCSLIILQRPLMDPDDLGLMAGLPGALRTATAAAHAITRLVKTLQASGDLRTVPHFMIFQVFRAALVHGLNMVFSEEAGGQRAPGNFWVLLRALGELGGTWKELGEIVMPFIHAATRTWGLDADKPPTQAEMEIATPDPTVELVGEETTDSPYQEDGQGNYYFMN
ncbi:hypothetical protein PT974_05739 [Cladobotryum mycophilum]|uniref:Xylanolytic transcriptional activator regulatory domain-containing protein n=1 Tax=Cladobotryum mycophilum TaxID=491253 RepID=A0ABR0SJL0_9HYPO